MLQINAANVPKTRKGAKGISVFRLFLFLEKTIARIPNIAPIQKASVIPANPDDMPNIHPIPSASFASPRPIIFPFDNTHIMANINARIGPADISTKLGMVNTLPTPLVFKNKEMNPKIAKVYESLSGIILWRISYTDITIRIEKAKAKYIKNKTNRDWFTKSKGEKCQAKNINTIPVTNSTRGY